VTEARKSLQREYEQAGKGNTFHELEAFLSEEPATGDYAAAAGRLKMTSGAVAVAVHRLRQRYGEMVRAEVTRTVVTLDEVEGEMRHLCSVLGTPTF
jgi:RNA polymerase sigma-70 factor (ECF subfamily)